MRGIKFRAWDKSENQMARSVTELLFNNKGLYGVKLNHMGFEFMRRIKDVELMQCADLDDMEIYEGDIFHLGDERLLYVVCWHDTGLKGKQQGCLGSYVGLTHWKSKIVIVGNIYQNPELLKGEAK